MSTNGALAEEPRVPQILAGTVIPTAIGSLFVVARLYTRGILNRTWGADDSFVAVAWVFSIGSAIIIGLQTNYGMGHHSSEQKPPDSAPFLKVSIVGRILFQLVLWFTKMSLCIFYRRVFQDNRSIHYINLIIGFLAISEILILILTLFQCMPIDGLWNFTLGKIIAVCMPLSLSIYVSAVCNIVADIVLIAFAIPRVLPLKVARCQKIALLAVVSLGTFVIVASLIRCISIVRIPLEDSLVHAAEASTWSAVEMQTGLICVSSPCVRPLLRRLFPGSTSWIPEAQFANSKERSRTRAGVYQNGVSLSRPGRGSGVRPPPRNNSNSRDQVAESMTNLCARTDDNSGHS